jgi:hypothetical protein
MEKRQQKAWSILKFIFLMVKLEKRIDLGLSSAVIATESVVSRSLLRVLVLNRGCELGADCLASRRV